MKKLHLVCNAHLDPIWQWDWEEGAAAAIATFQSAVNLADEFDYIFCHNEVTLYKYISDFAPALFEKIKELVKCGKWHIMGGWYLQPDVNMPTGESIVRQIQVGKKYFKEQFGVYPKAAIGFDAFGHSIGIVQIIKKCGQDYYLHWRPQENLFSMEDNRYIWRGLDGSELKCYRDSSYNTPLGNSRKAIENKMAAKKHEDVGLALWGVGNHGGGPSRKDLGDIAELIKESDVEILHSTPDEFFKEMKTDYVIDKSLHISMPGCYTSSMRMKQKHIELENQIYYAEKMMSVASLSGLAEYEGEKLSEAVEDLLNIEFHDILPGSSAKPGETNGLEYANHGLRIANAVRAKAYFALCSAQQVAKDGEYPVLVFNPHPYEITTNVEVEFNLADQNWTDNWTSFKVTCEGVEVASQAVKEESTINLDWRKKLIFTATLPPLKVTRFSVWELPLEKKEKAIVDRSKNIVISDEQKYVEIDTKTGLLVSYKVGGKEYLSGSAFELCFYDDNADPWAMDNQAFEGWHKNPTPFKLEEKPSGVFKNMESIQIIEDGKIYTGIEAFFKCENTRARIEYRIYKNSPYIDVNVNVFMNDVDKMLKLRLPVKDTKQLIGQCPFGADKLFMDGRENVSQRFIASIDGDGDCLALLNNCVYGSSFSFGNTIEMSLLRGVGYCVHPIDNRSLIPEGRYIKRMDQGEMNYSFRLCVAKENELEKMAMEFNHKPYAVNVFPTGATESRDTVKINIDNPNIVIETIKKSETADGYVVRLLNNSKNGAKATLYVADKSIDLSFGKYEAKTVVYNGELKEVSEMII